MQGDLKILLYEYASQNSMAEHALKNLPDHCSLVLETLERRQKLFCWKANLLTLESEESPERVRLKTEDADGTDGERRSTSRQTESAGPSDRTGSSAAGASAGPQTSTDDPVPLHTPKSGGEGPE